MQDLEVMIMNKEIIVKNEALYLLTMKVARNMLDSGLITTEEYRQIDTMFQAKYSPKIGTLFVDLSSEKR